MNHVRRDLAEDSAPTTAVARCVEILRGQPASLETRQVFDAGGFKYIGATEQALHTLWRRGEVTREKNDRGVYAYRIVTTASPRISRTTTLQVARTETRTETHTETHEEIEAPAPVVKVPDDVIEINVTPMVIVDPAPPAVHVLRESRPPLRHALGTALAVAALDIAGVAQPDPYAAAIADLAAKRDECENQLAELRLLKFLTDAALRDQLAFFLEDYADLLDMTMGDDGDGKITARVALARCYAKDFARANHAPASIFAAAAKRLLEVAQIDDDCERPAEAAQARKLAALFTYCGPKRSEDV